MKHFPLSALCGLGLWLNAQGQVILNLDLGNNALASNGAGFTKLGIASGDFAFNSGSFYLWNNVASSCLSSASSYVILEMTGVHTKWDVMRHDYPFSDRRRECRHACFVAT